MTAGLCGNCGAATGDGSQLCAGDTAMLRNLLRAVPDAMRELTITLTKRSRTRPPTGPQVAAPEIDPVKMPFNVGASRAKSDLKAVLAGWTRLVAEERPARLDCRENPTSMSGWLLQHIDWLRHYSGAADMLAEVRDTVQAVERNIDIREQLVYVGPCGGSCPGDLWAWPDAPTVTCRECFTVWDVEERKRRNVTVARNIVAPAELIATALTSNGVPVTAERIYKWRARGWLVPVSTSPTGRHSFRLGDVADEWKRRQAIIMKGRQ